MSVRYAVLLLFFLSILDVFTEDLQLAKDDVLIIQSPEGGYHLYIRAKPDIKSVLITETTKDPNLKLANYAYKDPNYNPINGDEKRLLNGEFILPEKKIYSLIDSTTEKGTPLGTAFHIWIPYTIEYGYAWGRNGEVEVVDGTFLNLRTFGKPYGDYTGSFYDNPFILKVTQLPIEKESGKDKRKNYSTAAEKSFTTLADLTDGRLLKAETPLDLLPLIEQILQRKINDKLELLMVIDATESMQDDMKILRTHLMPLLSKRLAEYSSYRVGLILYKDYKEDFLVKEACTFTDNLKKFEKAFSGFKVAGGRDIPEAVYEGLHSALIQPWHSDQDDTDRKIILIGDAPPHPKPRGKITKSMVFELALKKNVLIYPIILPHGNTY